ncbi:uncharacterized protein [Choristoneura fumiferana]|uniref:uncharacterized protein n=1 Tax=Choristoneura fumiferana TaxID=7141 RepID=UPI003D15E0F2
MHYTRTDATENVQQNINTDDISKNKQTRNEEKETSEDGRELLEEQEYWEQSDYTCEKLNSLKPKYANCQRMTQREMDMVTYKKTIARSPTYYQFDKSTTFILKMLRDKNIVGEYHNIVGYGKNSVVIHAHCIKEFHPMGVAVKVYKLNNDVIHDNAILKRVQREYDHLLMLQNQNKTWYVPYLIHKFRNVIVTDFVGFDQETAPSIAALPSEHSQEMYNILIGELYKLYSKIHLVHGRLSPKNILYIQPRNLPRYIGWAHSVSTEHPMAMQKLMKDCHFLTQFFQERGVSVVPKLKLFEDISGIDSDNIKAVNAKSKCFSTAHVPVLDDEDSFVTIQKKAQHKIQVTAKHEEPWNENSDREIYEEQQYWQMYDFTNKKTNQYRLKRSTAPKMTDRQVDLIAFEKTIARSPSFFNFDRFTTLVLEMLINKNIVREYNNVVYKGQNCVVIHAHRPGSSYSCPPIGFAVKVYRISNDSKNNSAIFKRFQREYDNLLMLENINRAYNPHRVQKINCICTYYKYRNIIVTDFVGKNQECAPTINSLPPERSEEMYHRMVEELKLLYNEAHLVHGNMSSKSILYCWHRPHYIGWSHAVLKDHPKALKKLIKDCYFITKFYERRNVPVQTTEQLFKDVTGLNSISTKVLDVINNKDLWRKQQSNPNRNEYYSTSNIIDRKPSRSSRFK